jgi:hypothetical protein
MYMTSMSQFISPGAAAFSAIPAMQRLQRSGARVVQQQTPATIDPAVAAVQFAASSPARRWVLDRHGRRRRLATAALYADTLAASGSANSCRRHRDADAHDTPPSARDRLHSRCWLSPHRSADNDAAYHVDRQDAAADCLQLVRHA